MSSRKKMVIDVYSDSVDNLVLSRLKDGLKCVNDPQFADLFPDRKELSAAFRTLIKYYGPARS